MSLPVPQSRAERARHRNATVNQLRSKPPPPLIIPAWIDDAGLTPIQFRVMAHIARRCGKGGTCYASIDSMRRVCRVKADTLRTALHELLRQGWITRTERAGRAAEYRIANPSRNGGGVPLPKEGSPTPPDWGET